MPDKKLNVLEVHSALRVNGNPLQTGRGDLLIRTAVVGGPELEGDRRFYFDKEQLGKLLEMARSSAMGRVIVGRAGVQVNLHQDASGHQYEVWTLIGADAKPEPVPPFVSAATGGK